MNTQAIGDEDLLKDTTKTQYKTTTVQLQS
jgi:hypothetical protein